MISTNGRKKCGVCKKLKPVSEFYPYNRGDGYQSYCRECSSAYAKKRYKIRIMLIATDDEDYKMNKKPHNIVNPRSYNTSKKIQQKSRKDYQHNYYIENKKRLQEYKKNQYLKNKECEENGKENISENSQETIHN